MGRGAGTTTTAVQLRPAERDERSAPVWVREHREHTARGRLTAAAESLVRVDSELSVTDGSAEQGAAANRRRIIHWQGKGAAFELLNVGGRVVARAHAQNAVGGAIEYDRKRINALSLSHGLGTLPRSLSNTKLDGLTRRVTDRLLGGQEIRQAVEHAIAEIAAEHAARAR